MTQTTTTHTNIPRRAHPAAVRAALRSQVRSDGRPIKQTDGNNNVTQFIYGDVASGLNRLLTKIIYPTLSQELKYDNQNRVTQSIASSAGAAQALDASSSQTIRDRPRIVLTTQTTQQKLNCKN